MPDEPTKTDIDELADVMALLDQATAPEPARKFEIQAPRPVEAQGDQTSFMDSLGIGQLRNVPDITKPWMKHHDFVSIKTVQQVDDLIDACIAAGKCSLDLECEGLDNRIYYKGEKPHTKHKVVGYCISVGDAKIGNYIPVGHSFAQGEDNPNVTPLADVEAAITRLCRASQPVMKPEAEDQLAGKDWETAPKVVIDFWHAAFDQEFLFPITGIDYWHPESFEDGNLACFTILSSDKNLSLKDKAEEVLKDPDGNPYEMIKLKELFLRGRKIEFHTLHPEEPGVVKYACSDAICTRLLGADKDILPVIKKEGYTATYRLEKQVSQVKRVMERNRVKVDRSRIMELLETHNARLSEIRTRIVSLAASKGFPGFEPNSPKQLGDLLFGQQGFNIDPKPALTANGQFKTDEDTIEAIGKELGANAPLIFTWILDFREEVKLIGTYLKSMSENLDLNDELRFGFKQTGAATGRFSAPKGKPDHGYAGIPIHGIPATSDLRTCFIARPGYTMAKLDYAGQELRIVTNLSHEPVWIKEFLEGDGDLHTITAQAFFNKASKADVTKEERKGGKIANFALVYGGGPAAIMRATGCDKVEGARRKQAFDKAVPTFAKWVKGQHASVKKNLGVWTAFKRWVAIPDANSMTGNQEQDNKVRAACERYATNYPIQGSGADIMKLAMVLCHKALYKKGWIKGHGIDAVRMLLTVHDEIVFEILDEYVTQVIPVLVTAMERPTRLASTPWQVPLITEPLIGPTWGTGYPCEREKPDHKFKEGEKSLGGFVYSNLRVVDMNKDGTPKDKPVAGEVIHKFDKEKKKVTIRYDLAKWMDFDPPAAVEPTPSKPGDGSSGGGGDGPPPPQAQVPQVPTPQVQVPKVQSVIEAAPSKKNGSLRVATMRITVLTRRSLSQVRRQCAEFIDPDHGDLLQILDGMSENKCLVDPKLGIRVKADLLAKSLADLNISDGKVHYQPTQ